MGRLLGWLPTELSYSFDPSITIAPSPEDNLIALVNEIYERNADRFPKLPTSQAQPFYLFWRTPWVPQDLLPLMTEVLQEAAQACPVIMNWPDWPMRATARQPTN